MSNHAHKRDRAKGVHKNVVVRNALVVLVVLITKGPNEVTPLGIELLTDADAQRHLLTPKFSKRAWPELRYGPFEARLERLKRGERFATRVHLDIQVIAEPEVLQMKKLKSDGGHKI